MNKNRKRPQAQKQRYTVKTVRVSRDIRAPRYDRASMKRQEW